MKKIDREHWLKGIATAKRSQDRGKLQAAVTRLERVQRQIEKKLQVSVVSRWRVALLHQQIAVSRHNKGTLPVGDQRTHQLIDCWGKARKCRAPEMCR
jgi:hypothetical protein